MQRICFNYYFYSQQKFPSQLSFQVCSPNLNHKQAHMNMCVYVGVCLCICFCLCVYNFGQERVLYASQSIRLQKANTHICSHLMREINQSRRQSESVTLSLCVCVCVCVCLFLSLFTRCDKWVKLLWVNQTVSDVTNLLAAGTTIC